MSNTDYIFSDIYFMFLFFPKETQEKNTDKYELYCCTLHLEVASYQYCYSGRGYAFMVVSDDDVEHWVIQDILILSFLIFQVSPS